MPTHPVATTLVPVSQIHRNPDQPRKFFDPQANEDLKESINERGLINAISVKQRSEGDYLIVAGERRFRACCELGWTEIDCRIWPAATPPQEVELLSIVENVQRTDLTPLELANGFQVMTREPYKLTQDQIAKQVGKSQQTIGHYVTIGQLDPKVQEITNRLVNLGLAHLLQLSRLKTPEDQITLAQEAAQKDLSVKELKALVDKQLAKDPKSKKKELKVSDPLGPTWGMLKDSKAQINSNADWAVHYAEEDKKAIWQIRVSLPRSGAERQLPSWLIHLGQSVDQWLKGYDKEKKEADAFVLQQKQVIDQVLKPLRFPESKEEWAELETLRGQGPGAVAEWICGKGNPRVEIWTKTTWTAKGYNDPVKGCHELVAEFKKHPLGV